MRWGETEKFGGSSLADADSLNQSTEVIRVQQAKALKDSYGIIVVNSAMGTPRGTDIAKLTDLLQRMENALYNGDFKEAYRLKMEFTERQHEVIFKCGLEGIVDYAYKPHMKREHLFSRLDELFMIYQDMHRQMIDAPKNFHPWMMDQFMCLGEPITSGYLAANLIKNEIPALAMHSADIGLLTDDSYQNANVLPGTLNRMRERLFKLRRESKDSRFIPVIAGYAGRSFYGTDTTQGRGTGDLSGSQVAYAAKTPLIIWTDVDGIYDGTPKIIKNPKVLEEISFDEALELATHGATAIHPKAVQQAKESGKPMYVRNTFDPNHQGTRIVTHRRTIPGIVKALTVLPEVTIIEAGCSSAQYASFLSYVTEKGIMLPLDSYTEGRAEIVLGIPDLTDEIKIKLHELGIRGNRLSYSKNKYVIKLVGDGIGQLENHKDLLAHLYTLYAKAIEQKGVLKSKPLFPLLHIHPSSIGFVTGHRAGPEIANALYDAHIRRNNST